MASKDMSLSPGAAPPERPELLGSLTTQQQQRTSARVIKKLRLDDAHHDADKKDHPECDTLKHKEDEKDHHPAHSAVKQRMPKAIWSIDEKNLFFEALNEYGKDFDAITAYICAKIKKKGASGANLKTKNQVSHFYYRTWHKLAKHLHFDENVKKVAQELYALINYGELRKRLFCVKEKTCARLSEMVNSGKLVFRARGRTVRVRTPSCRALRRLNHLTERSEGSRCAARCTITLRARTAAAWARVQAAAHNPRCAAPAPLACHLRAFLESLACRWGQGGSKPKTKFMACYLKEDGIKEYDKCQELKIQCGEEADEEKTETEDLLNLEPDRIIVQDHRQPKKLALHVGPPPSAVIQLPVLTASEHLSAQSICFSSYLERMATARTNKESKIRTPKRQRKDSATDKDRDIEQKRMKSEESETKMSSICMDETAIDGIELMANYKNIQEDKPSTENDIKLEQFADELEERDAVIHDNASERDKDMSEREKDSFSEMEDDEKFIKSESDNESDHGKNEKVKPRKFKNLKVKFRIRQKKRGGSVYTLVGESKDAEEQKGELSDEQRILDDQVKNIDDQAKNIDDQAKNIDDQAKNIDDQAKSVDDPTKNLDDHLKDDKGFEDQTKAVDIDFVTKQIRKGWSVYDAGNLTIGDLYLMWGSRSKLELDYWWAEPTAPLPQSPTPSYKFHRPTTDNEKLVERTSDKDKKEKSDKTPEKGTDSSHEDAEKRESDTDIFSPKNTFSQDSNDALSGDERKNEQLMSPEHKLPTNSVTIASKLINRPDVTNNYNNNKEHLATVSDRLKRLLSLVGNPHFAPYQGQIPSNRCTCGHVCAHKKKASGPINMPMNTELKYLPTFEQADSPPFRHPTPIAPKPDQEVQKHMNIADLPSRLKRGRPRLADRHVVVQRLLPLLPKLPSAQNLIPVKMTPSSTPQPPRILPKPPAVTSESSCHVYVLSESKGQFYFHDGDRRIPINPSYGIMSPDPVTSDEFILGDAAGEGKAETESAANAGFEPNGVDTFKEENRSEADIASFLPSESMSLSPSRLLRDTEGAWLDGSVQDFSLSSFLGQLEARTQPDLAVDSQLQSLMAESSIDYVAKFADLAAEVTDELDPLATPTRTLTE